MSLLEEIQQAAVDGNQDLGTVLRKCKLLAARLGSKPLEDWLLWESNGYPKGVPVPDYRIWQLTLKGHFAGPFGSAYNNAPIPLACLPEAARKSYEFYENRESIAAIETVLSRAKDKPGSLNVNTGDLAMVLGMKVYKNMNCVQAWAEVENGRLVEVLNSVRNKILDFSVAIWKEAPEAGQTVSAGASPAIASAEVTQIFNTTVYGGAANVVGTANQSTISFGITAGDFESLAKVLRENKILPEDLADLKEALTAEVRPKEGGGFGPKVSAWFGKMIQKASDGSWEVGIQAAGALLGQAISKYYGIS